MKLYEDKQPFVRSENYQFASNKHGVIQVTHSLIDMEPGIQETILKGKRLKYPTNMG